MVIRKPQPSRYRIGKLAVLKKYEKVDKCVDCSCNYEAGSITSYTLSDVSLTSKLLPNFDVFKINVCLSDNFIETLSAKRSIKVWRQKIVTRGSAGEYC